MIPRAHREPRPAASPAAPAPSGPCIRSLVRGLPGAKVRYRLEPGTVFVELLAVPHPRRGHGSLLLARLLEATDRQGLDVELVADSTDRPQDPDTYSLCRWYHAFGFRPVAVDEDGVRMRRAAHPPMDAPALLAQASVAPRLEPEDFQQWEAGLPAAEVLGPGKRSGPSSIHP